MHAVTVLFVFLAFCAQDGQCFFEFINYSTPDQCGPFTVEFSRAITPAAVPLSLTIVPFSANPIPTSLPSDAWNASADSGSARVTFLPFPSGTQFVASLDDGNGKSTSFVSDVIVVKDSNVTTCLAPNQKEAAFYHIRGDLTQCSRFNVTFDPSVIQTIPSIRAFLPRSFSFLVNVTDTPVQTISQPQRQRSNRVRNKDDNDDGDDDSDDNGGGDGLDSSDDDDKDDNNGGGNGGNGNNGRGARTSSIKEYLLNVRHGAQADLMFDDGPGHRQSSRLFTAGGTSSSSNNCFKESFNLPSHIPNASQHSSPRHGNGLSKTATIIVSVLSACVVASLSVIILIIWRRRRRLRKEGNNMPFIFTEDVDMGSSFMSHVPAGISYLTYRKRSFHSYRGYRDEKDDGSAYIPTSPIGSPAAPVHLRRPEKQASWVEIDTVKHPEWKLESLGNGVISSAMFPTLIEDNSFSFASQTRTNVRLSKPDVPIPGVLLSSESYRFLLGTGYLSSRPSSASMSMNTATKKPECRLSLLVTYQMATSHSNTFSTDMSASGCMLSRSSKLTTDPDDNGIYVSSPIRPLSLELPASVSSEPATNTIERRSSPVMHDPSRLPRYPILRSLFWETRTQGTLPFPTSSLRSNDS